MPLSIQVKLLRVLQDGTFSRVGSNETITHRRADHRRHPQESDRTRSTAGSFREDLYYRLNVVEIRIPPLRERLEDIPLLAEFFLQRITKKNGMARIRLSAEAINTLQCHTWPGNVRELENTIARACALASSNILLPADIPLGFRSGKISGACFRSHRPIDQRRPHRRGPARLGQPRDRRPDGGTRGRRSQGSLRHAESTARGTPETPRPVRTDMFQIIDHPLIADELTRLRDPACPSPEFRQRVRRIASLMVPAVTADLATHVVPCTTPLEITSGSQLTPRHHSRARAAGRPRVSRWLSRHDSAGIRRPHRPGAKRENAAAGALLHETPAGFGRAGHHHPRSRCWPPAARPSKRCAA